MFCPVCRAEYQSDWKACPKDATLLLKSAQIGKYTIEGLLGVGGMGAVYRASNPDTRGRVAIKVMNPAFAGAESARVRFQREAAAVAALNTTHVVKVYDFGTESDGMLYLVMELLQGHPLRDEIGTPPNTMELARVQMVMEGALRGLAAAHKAGIVHRDLKPENVFVSQTDDGEVPKLVDFGIARVRTADSDLTRTGTLVGTASYMAPEQIAAGMGDIGPWSDIYSMGSILYELLAGVPAVGGDSITNVLQRVLRSEIESLATLRPGLPAETYKLVERCMSGDPTVRPQDADAMRRDLISARLVVAGTQVPVARITRPRNDSVELAHTSLPMSPTPVPPIVPVSASGATVVSREQARLAATPEPAGESSRAEVPMASTRRPRWPLALVGVVLAGGGAAFVLTRHGEPKRVDKPAILVLDAALAPIDAPVLPVVVIDAATPDPRAATMVLIAAGTHDVGVLHPKGDDRPPGHATLPAYWIDRHEMTKGELGSALADKLPPRTIRAAKGDPLGAPARFVDLATAAAACQAVGKRLPTEDEWEVAARTTPQDATRARLKRKGTDEDLLAASTDCSEAGLCDMLGSLREWTTTPYSVKHPELVVRGPSYRFNADDPQLVISIHERLAVGPATTDNELGFRCVAAKGP